MNLPSPPLFALLREAYRDFQNDEAPRLGAALAYYTIFSIAPVLIIVIGIAGLALGEEAVRGELFRQIAGLVGPDGAKFIQDTIAAAANQKKSGAAAATGVVILFIGATGVFMQLQNALNTVWNVKSVKQGFFSELVARWTSFTMVLGIGFLLLVSLFLTTILALLGDLFPHSFAGTIIAEVFHSAATIGIATVLFALMFRVLPGVIVPWRDVWLGSALTAVLFVVGKLLLGYYLGRATVGSAYGAAGTAVVLLVWVYYSSQILLYGAECTQALAKLRKRKVTLRPGYTLASDDAWDVNEKSEKPQLKKAS